MNHTTAGVTWEDSGAQVPSPVFRRCRSGRPEARAIPGHAAPRHPAHRPFEDGADRDQARGLPSPLAREDQAAPGATVLASAEVLHGRNQPCCA
ncbi:hypothetical protein ABT040_44175 [Streptomyces sp. NPDC002688]|uniref:hypothetical protein n=1 Tax=Streptomyces sp. NPDC002688 TaxID=3154423 RepID=UPI00331A76AB